MLAARANFWPQIAHATRSTITKASHVPKLGSMRWRAGKKDMNPIVSTHYLQAHSHLCWLKLMEDMLILIGVGNCARVGVSQMRLMMMMMMMMVMFRLLHFYLLVVFFDFSAVNLLSPWALALPLWLVPVMDLEPLIWFHQMTLAH